MIEVTFEVKTILKMMLLKVISANVQIFWKDLVILIVFQNGNLNYCPINNLTTSYNSFAPALTCIGNKTRVKLDWSCLTEDAIALTRWKIVNI